MLWNSAEGRQASEALVRYGALGFSLALGIAFFSWLGYLADARFGSAPAGLAAGCLLGAGLGLYKLIRDVVRQSVEDEPEQDG